MNDDDLQRLKVIYKDRGVGSLSGSCDVYIGDGDRPSIKGLGLSPLVKSCFRENRLFLASLVLSVVVGGLGVATLREGSPMDLCFEVFGRFKDIMAEVPMREAERVEGVGRGLRGLEGGVSLIMEDLTVGARLDILCLANH